MKSLIAVSVVVFLVVSCSSSLPRPEPNAPDPQKQDYCASKPNCGLCASEGNCVFCSFTNKCMLQANAVVSAGCEPEPIRTPEGCP